MRRQLLPYLASTGMIALLAGALYVPYLSNPLVFDDLPFFSGAGFAHFATTPLGLELRLLPHFTLAFSQALWGYFPPSAHPEMHRLWSLAFHIASSLALFKLLRDLLRGAGAVSDAGTHRDTRVDANALAFVGAAAFAIHPVAVYGAGYLIQRTVVLATLFSLLSIAYFVRGLTRGRGIDAVTAALFYTLAVFSKEHSVLLPLAAVMTAPLVAKDRRFAIRYGAVYLLACAPAGLTVVTLVRSVIGNAYEPNYDVLMAQIEGIPAIALTGGAWLVSAITQTGLFFKYLAAWLAPNTAAMSVDIRIDFAQTWAPGWILLKLAAYVTFGTAGLVLLRRGGRAGLAGFGLLYCWTLFLVELTSVRFQEPFVLYRSYLWAPGISIALISFLSSFSRRAVLAMFAAVCPVLLYQANDRLQTFSSTLALWEDAAAKLSPAPIPWGSRTLYNLGREQLYAGQPAAAVATVNRCMERYPATFFCYLARGSIHIELEDYRQALPYLTRALMIYPNSGAAHHHRGIALEKLGQLDEARNEYREASRLQYAGGAYRLGLLDSSGGANSLVPIGAGRSPQSRE